MTLLPTPHMLKQGLLIVLPAVGLWLGWAALYLYVAAHNHIAVPSLRLCHVPLYAAGLIQAPAAPAAVRPAAGAVVRPLDATR